LVDEPPAPPDPAVVKRPGLNPDEIYIANSILEKTDDMRDRKPGGRPKLKFRTIVRVMGALAPGTRLLRRGSEDQMWVSLGISYAYGADPTNAA
jgi:hypothetical protein